MHRFFVEKESIFPTKAIIEDPDSIKKIRQVLRLNVGDKIWLFDGEGGEYLASVKTLQKTGIMVDIEEKVKKEKGSKPHYIVGQALTRSTKIDEIVRMNTEIGADEFVFFESQYSIVKQKDFNENKLGRWEKIAEEATRQSERSNIPEINEPITFEEALKIEADLKIILHSRKDSSSEDLKSLKEKINSDSKILLLIGPEGGFSKREIDLAKEKDFVVGYLNLPVLRTETAGVVASAVLLS